MLATITFGAITKTPKIKITVKISQKSKGDTIPTADTMTWTYSWSPLSVWLYD